MMTSFLSRRIRSGGATIIVVALVWLWLVDGVRPTWWDLLGCAVAMLGMAIIMFAPRTS